MLELEKISKYFGLHPALRQVSLTVAAGEIHGLIGLNGSGKSTLLNILFGARNIGASGGYTGACRLDGCLRRFRNPGQAIAAGIGMVHQEHALIPEMSVTDNVLITREPTHPLTDRLFPHDLSLVDTTRAHHQAQSALQEIGLDLDPRRKAANLPIHIKQFIEIAREISRTDVKLLLLDEPTAVLGGSDSAKLKQALRRLASRGVAMLFVSHRLEEVLEMCSRLTVLRDGNCLGTFARESCTIDSLTRLLTPNSVTSSRRKPHPATPAPASIASTAGPATTPTAEPILSVRNLQVAMPGDALHRLDLDITHGEILGIASLSGHGKLALGAGIIGLFPYQGSVTLKNKAQRPACPAEMIRRGVFLLADERYRYGLLLQHSVMDNIVFSALHQKGRFLRRGPLGLGRLPDRAAIHDYTTQCIATYDIGCRGVRQKVGELSGGNQQKVCIAHALTLEPELLFVSEPTRGIDIAAKERILDLFVEINHRLGITIVLASSELGELKRICHRIAVLHQGRLAAIFDPTADDLLLTRAMAGVAPASQ